MTREEVVDDGEEGWVSGDDSVSFNSDVEDWVDPSGGSLGDLQKVCEEGGADKVPALLEKLKESGISIDHLGQHGDTALHLACLYGHSEIVDLLLAAGANAGLTDENGGTPLHDAAAGGFEEIVQKLLANQAEAGIHKIADSDGDTPLHNAARGNHLTIVSLLLEAGADATCRNEAGHAPADLCDKNTALQTLLMRAAGLEDDATPE